jgi:hypothetical protein
VAPAFKSGDYRKEGVRRYAFKSKQKKETQKYGENKK